MMQILSLRSRCFATLTALAMSAPLCTDRPWQSLAAAQEPTATPPTVQDGQVIQAGDRVVLIGGGWVERMHNHPWFEMMMTLQLPGVTFRNMGWSGDTVHGDARAVFGARTDGYQRLMRDLDYAAPKVAIVTYGENEAMGGEAERSEFVAGYHKLIDDLKRKECRVVLVIPRRRESAGAQYPDPDAYNENLSQVAEAIRKLAAKHQCALIDLEKFAPDQRFTLDGIAWNDEGYRQSATEMMRQLGFSNSKFDALDKTPDAIEELRIAIRKKNEWFFHRFRPQNETYLFLFRKHEQGNNAVEVEQMEKFVRDGEQGIVQWLTQKKWNPAP